MSYLPLLYARASGGRSGSDCGDARFGVTSFAAGNAVGTDEVSELLR